MSDLSQPHQNVLSDRYRIQCRPGGMATVIPAASLDRHRRVAGRALTARGLGSVTADREGGNRMPSKNWRFGIRVAAVCALGFLLMIVGHLLGLMGWAAAAGSAFHPPYWWAYLFLYPIATAILIRGLRASWLLIALSLCAAPLMYFLGLGLLEGRWFASEGALWGAVLALGLSALVARRGRRMGLSARP